MTSNPQILLEMKLVNVPTHKLTGSPDQPSEYFIKLPSLESFCSCACLS